MIQLDSLESPEAIRTASRSRLYSLLAAVVIAASLSLADIPGVNRIWQQRRTEFGLSIAAFLAAQPHAQTQTPAAQLPEQQSEA